MANPDECMWRAGSRVNHVYNTLKLFIYLFLLLFFIFIYLFIYLFIFYFYFFFFLYFEADFVFRAKDAF